MHPPLRLAAAALVAACLAGCAPALDWRDVRPAGTALQMQFPCKPVEQQRQVALAGAPVRLVLLACSADRQTWGLAHADVADPARVTPALLQLRASAAANVAIDAERPTTGSGEAAALSTRPQSAAPPAPPAPLVSSAPPASSAPLAADGARERQGAAGQALQVPGSTPNAAGAHAGIAGKLPDGTPVQMQLVVFTHGTRVFQATVLGEHLTQGAAETYFASMAIRP